MAYSKTNSNNEIFENNNVKDNVSSALKTLPSAYKSAVAGKPLVSQKQLLM